MALILASKSPRRIQLMQLVAGDFHVVTADVEEVPDGTLSPAAQSLHFAKQKAQHVSEKYPGDVVIGCDTVVDLNGALLGKPKNKRDAFDVLSHLSAERHFVHTGVYVFAPDWREGFVETTAVDFTAIPAAQIESYIETEEPYDKAGGYAIQGWAARFISRVEGCFYNVMGLPVSSLYHLLKAHKCGDLYTC